MVVYPIIPVWLMSIICIVFLIIILMPKEIVNNLLRYRKLVLKVNKKMVTKLKLIEKGIWILILILAFAINLRPMIPSGEAELYVNEMDVLFAIDTTVSMDALDGRDDSKRFDDVKKDISMIMDKLSGSKFAVVSFDNTFRIVTPYTANTTIVKNSIDSLNVVDIGYANGSSLNVVYDAIKVAIGNYRHEERKVVLFVFSDGEITEEKNKLKSFDDLKDIIDDGAILGYGTTKGAEIKVDEQDTSYSFYKDSDNYLLDRSTYPYKRAVSVLDEKNLKQIANDIGITYVNMNKTSNIDTLLDSIEKSSPKRLSTTSIYSCDDTYYIYTIVLVILLGAEYVLYRMNQKEGVRNEK